MSLTRRTLGASLGERRGGANEVQSEWTPGESSDANMLDDPIMLTNNESEIVTSETDNGDFDSELTAGADSDPYVIHTYIFDVFTKEKEKDRDNKGDKDGDNAQLIKQGEKSSIIYCHPSPQTVAESRRFFIVCHFHFVAMSSPSSPRAAPSDHAQSEAKRRKLRKGTHSCWECKRRKMKCIFDTDTTTCNGCRRRGSQCISQEFPEDVSLISTDSTTYGYGGRTSTTPSEDGRRADHNIRIPTPVSMISEPSRSLAFYAASEARIPNFEIVMPCKYEKLSRFLHASLPSREDTERICTASRHPSILAHEIMTMPYDPLDQNGVTTHNSLLEIPGPDLHPVLISRHMLLLATFLQHLHPDLHKEIKGLSESPRAIMERLTDLAVSLVTTNDELLGSIEGLECVMIESVYQANIGNIRRSWMSGRRAMNIAQLMGLNRSDNQAQYNVLDPKKEYHPQLMWFRIVFLDRYLCLMLGLSQGCLDRSMASDAMLANDTPMGRLERIHCVIASRILERNELKTNLYNHDLTQTLDVELQRAARSLPGKWWLVPNLAVTTTDSQALFWNTRRLFAQIIHYNLLNQLHLPYMLRSSSTERKYEYSLIACVNASREMLSRFIILRTFNGIAYSCRTVDFLALMAAMTLLLAHLDSPLSEAENLLAHQYHSDRAMIEQVQENMEQVNRLNSDALSAKSANLLRRLLTIEVETANGTSLGAKGVSVQETGTETALPDQGDDAAVSVHIPYFGIIKIAREGISKEVPKSQATATTNPPTQSRGVNSAGAIHAEPQMCPSTLAETGGTPDDEAITPVVANYIHVEAPLMMSNTHANFESQLQNDFSDPLFHDGEYPGLAAGAEDWAFQGVDLAFFDSLIRSTGHEGDVL
ncbi:hypothetical protein G7Y89_g15392 [Cudoniella acicularis]|uniref:Zn(2)-C6 fungal-type domain-containing protein n=1 Tax=Cudoniella acicularis TaxID=354080 RepID=A0A8H4QND1_9HELO|nr:hypothetical protein G7Y89_g15392 [Cudoniella acicularis]